MSGALDIRPQPQIPEVLEIVVKRHLDERGFFTELYSRRLWQESGIDLDFVQTNHSFSARRGTLRGLHFQTPPAAQAKLVSVPRGRILDVAADIRKGSPTFGKAVAVEISGERGNQLLVPAGFAHGFVTLEPDTHVQYMVTNYYAPAHDAGIRWNDPTFGIEWPFAESDLLLSPKDRVFPFLADMEPPFSA